MFAQTRISRTPKRSAPPRESFGTRRRGVAESKEVARRRGVMRRQAAKSINEQVLFAQRRRGAERGFSAPLRLCAKSIIWSGLASSQACSVGYTGLPTP